MATAQQCEQALHQLAARLAQVDGDLRRQHAVDRTVSCTLKDLGVTYLAEVDGDGLSDLRTGEARSAQVRLTMTSDDLLALVDGRLHLATAWARGQVKITAGITDLFRLRSLLG